MHMPSVEQVKRLPPQWWAAVAGAGVAGATILADHRILGGLGAAAAMLYLALQVGGAGPCCASCADGAGVRTAPAPSAPRDVDGGPDGGLDDPMASLAAMARAPVTARAPVGGCQ